MDVFPGTRKSKVATSETACVLIQIMLPGLLTASASDFFREVTELSRV